MEEQPSALYEVHEGEKGEERARDCSCAAACPENVQDPLQLRKLPWGYTRDPFLAFSLPSFSISF